MSILVVAVSAFLPWVSFFGASAIGIEGDGVFTLILALAGAVVLALTSGAVGAPRVPGRVSQIILLVLAAQALPLQPPAGQTDLPGNDV